jgi:hypothetical protein
LASVGAAALSEEAARLEAAGKTGDAAFIRERIGGFRENLSGLAGHIGTALAAGADAQKFSESEPGADHYPLLRELADALKAERPRAIDRLLEELNQKSLGAETKESLERIANHVLMAKFDEALKITDALRNGKEGLK